MSICTHSGHQDEGRFCGSVCTQETGHLGGGGGAGALCLGAGSSLHLRSPLGFKVKPQLPLPSPDPQALPHAWPASPTRGRWSPTS